MLLFFLTQYLFERIDGDKQLLVPSLNAVLAQKSVVPKEQLSKQVKYKHGEQGADNDFNHSINLGKGVASIMVLLYDSMDFRKT